MRCDLTLARAGEGEARTHHDAEAIIPLDPLHEGGLQQSTCLSVRHGDGRRSEGYAHTWLRALLRDAGGYQILNQAFYEVGPDASCGQNLHRRTGGPRRALKRLNRCQPTCHAHRLEVVDGVGRPARFGFRHARRLGAHQEASRHRDDRELCAVHLFNHIVQAPPQRIVKRPLGSGHRAFNSRWLNRSTRWCPHRPEIRPPGGGVKQSLQRNLRGRRPLLNVDIYVQLKSLCPVIQQPMRRERRAKGPKDGSGLKCEEQFVFHGWHLSRRELVHPLGLQLTRHDR